MIVFPGSKINIGLNITGKRPDGFHSIESIFYPLPLSDILEIVPSNHFSIQTSGLSIQGNSEDNLVVKAYRLLEKEYKIPPVQIILHKIVPMGAGLGGGSADCAATLTMLNTLFDLNINDETLEKHADSLGSDCAFFIKNKPAYVTGKGELLENIPLQLNGYYIYLINPGIHVSTKTAFAGISCELPTTNLQTLTNTPINNWKETVKNDFEHTIFPIHPQIKNIKDKLYENGALYASMTGTGSSVYGIFETIPKKTFSNYYEWISTL